jgi:hypothetical protein
MLTKIQQNHDEHEEKNRYRILNTKEKSTIKEKKKKHKK